jgi:GMP synthase (glutamine-hydrolysing)
VKPFLFLGTRAEDDAADGEFMAVLHYSGLTERQLERVRLERQPLGCVDLARYSGVLLGGGPFNSSDPEPEKSSVQRRVEGEVARLLDDVVALDFPFLGACYGIGTLGLHQGATVDRRYGEPVGRVGIELSDEGRSDDVFGGLPDRFEAYVGHKEAVHTLPPHVVRLASSAACPVQAFRVGRNVYATQFHPELDFQGLSLRVQVYRNHGYFPPEEAERIIDEARGEEMPHPPEVLRRFVARYAATP